VEIVVSNHTKEMFSYKETHPKTQIILCHTSRPILSYLNSLYYRLDGHFRKIPTYLISRDGMTFKNFDIEDHSDFMGDPEVDQQAVVICLENLGWLKYDHLNNMYINWIGDIYKGEVYQKRWRDHTYWAHYPSVQLRECAILLKEVCENLGIPLKLLGHNVKVEGTETFSGIVSRSNYNELWTDVSPSFDFNKLKKYIDEEEDIE